MRTFLHCYRALDGLQTLGRPMQTDALLTISVEEWLRVTWLYWGHDCTADVTALLHCARVPNLAWCQVLKEWCSTMHLALQPRAQP